MVNRKLHLIVALTFMMFLQFMVSCSSSTNSPAVEIKESTQTEMADLVTSAVKRARADLAKRLGVPESDIKEDGVERVEFPNASLGAGVDGEMSAQMITNGHRILLSYQDKGFEYRTSGTTLRLYKFKGENHRVD